MKPAALTGVLLAVRLSKKALLEILQGLDEATLCEALPLLERRLARLRRTAPLLSPSTPVEDLPLSRRAKNVLGQLGLRTAGEACAVEEGQWQRTQGVGEALAAEIQSVLRRVERSDGR